MPLDCRSLSLRAESTEELASWVADAHARVLLPPTRVRPEPGEPLLVDLQVEDRRYLVPVRARYTVPQRRGPFLVAAQRAQHVIPAILRGDGSQTRRARWRYPLDQPVLVATRDRLRLGRLHDASVAAARVGLLEELAAGTRVQLTLLGELPEGFPRALDGRVTDGRWQGNVVHFDDGDGELGDAWRRLRRWLRRADERGRAPLPWWDTDRETSPLPLPPIEPWYR